MSGPATHLLATYYLPSWQGGDVLLPRCQIGAVGYYIEPGRAYVMTRDPDFVSCPSCLGIMAHGLRPALRVAA